jgi:hypothetical protein
VVPKPFRRTHQRDPSDVPAEVGRGGCLQVPHGVRPGGFRIESGRRRGPGGVVQGGSPLAPRNSGGFAGDRSVMSAVILVSLFLGRSFDTFLVPDFAFFEKQL